jgi:hypothetical protein
MILEAHGLLIGVLLLIAVSASAFLLAQKAARNVEAFRDDQHQQFARRDAGR